MFTGGLGSELDYMDPAGMMNEGSFANGNAGNTASFNLSEIWQFPMNGGARLGESGGGLGLRRPPFGYNMGQFGDFSGPNRDLSGTDPNNSEQRANNHIHGINRKRRDSEDESAAKGVSTSNDGGNGVVSIHS